LIDRRLEAMTTLMLAKFNGKTGRSAHPKKKVSYEFNSIADFLYPPSARACFHIKNCH
jgi:hypothetical protein